MKNFVRYKKVQKYLLSFIIPVSFLVIIMAYLKIVPFGDTSVLMWDAEYQYKDYYGYLWDILHGNASVEYFSGKSLGGKMMGLFCYYLSSPLNLLLLFFEKGSITIFLSVITILKIGLCGLTSQIYFSNRFGLSLKYSILLSTLYALMEYNVYYCRNIMWLDGVIMLPIVLLGVYKLISEKKKNLLWFSVTVVIMANWYTGYMVCLMAGIYFMYEACLYFDGALFADLKNKLLLFGKFVMTMLGGVLSSMVILLPACMSLIGGKATTVDSLKITGKINFDLFHFLRGFDISGSGYELSGAIPLIFCGSLTLILSVYYFLNKGIRCKERIITAVFLLFLAASFCLHDLELLWTGFVESFSFFYRFAFVFSFAMLMVSAKAIKCIEERGIEAKYVRGSVAIIILFGFCLYYDKSLVSDTKIFILYLLVLVGIIAFSTSKNSMRNKYCLLSICYIVTISELVYNTQLAFREYTSSDSMFSNYVKDFEKVLATVEDDANGAFYRLEKPYSYLTNKEDNLRVATCESALFGYNSIEFYSSTYDNPVDTFLMRMGYSDWTSKQVRPTETYWNSPMLLPDSLLSVKYAVLNKPGFGYGEIKNVSTKPFKTDVQIYKNEYALPLGYNVSMNALQDFEYGKNPFENQEKLISSFCGTDTNVYENLYIRMIESNDHGLEEYCIKTVCDGSVYVYLNGADIHENYGIDNCKLYVDGEFVQNICMRFRTNGVYIGDFGANQEISIVIQRKTDLPEKHELYAAQLNKERFKNIIDIIKTDCSSTLNVQGNKISGSYTTQEDALVMVSLPYEESWEAWIDGEKASIEKVSGMFIGLNVPEGTHDIYMVYKCPGLRMGFCMSLLGIGLFVVISLYEKRRMHKQ